MSEEQIPSLMDLMSTVAAGSPVSFNRSQIVIAHTVSGVEQQNSSADSHSGAWAEIAAFLPAGVPTSILPIGLRRQYEASDWVKDQEATPDPIPVPTARQWMASVMQLYRHLRDWCRSSHDHALCREGLDSLSRLAVPLLDLDPDAVIDIFDDLEPTLKHQGDFELMMRYAKLAVEACDRTARRDRRTVELRTQATTCGYAWVLQRLGHLRDTSNQLDLDEQLNRDAGELRGLAFTLKCRGRLKRLMADRSDYAGTKDLVDSFLTESIHDLEAARSVFQDISDGDRAKQVADTDALIARTYLATGNLTAARQRLERAQLLGPASLSKTIQDCLILEDELEATERLKTVGPSGPPPVSRIDQVLARATNDAYAKNEIHARALFAKAKILAEWSMDFGQFLEDCRRIYESLHDLNAAAEVEWWRISKTENPPESVRELLAPLAPVVRVKAYSAYKEQYGEPQLSAAMNRTRGMGDSRWAAIIAQSKRDLIMLGGGRW